MHFTTFVRIKPQFKNEILSQKIKISKNEFHIQAPKNPSKTKRTHNYPFDKIFTPTIKQEQIFQTSAKPVIEQVLKGKNGALLVYGETGSGKTYTMLGSSIIKS